MFDFCVGLCSLLVCVLFCFVVCDCCSLLSVGCVLLLLVIDGRVLLCGACRCLMFVVRC